MSGIAIVGGGLAGAYAAALLARSGLAPLLLERRAESADKVCGEFLSTEAGGYLAAVGLAPEELGGRTIDRVRLAAGGRIAEARLPFRAFGLSRRRLDAALLDRAEALGADVRRGVAVRAALGGALETGLGRLQPARTVLATGKHEVRGAQRHVRPSNAMIGFKTYLRLAPAAADALRGAVELVFFEGGYAGLVEVEDGRANLCLVVRADAFLREGRAWSGLLARLRREPHLAARLDGAIETLARPLSIANLPYGFRHAPAAGESLYRIGDQAAVIDSFTGDGMAIALHSAALAARAIAAGADPATYHARLAADLARSMRVSAWLRHRLEAWPGPAAALAALGLCPWLVGPLAAWTRIPRRSLR